jgi:hypothetical protein
MMLRCLLTGGLIALAVPALAGNDTRVMNPPHPMSGYVELRGGWDGGGGSGVDDCCGPHHDAWNGDVVGGAGRVAVGLSPNTSVQADAWTNVWTGSGSGDQGGPFSYSYSNAYSGIAVHLTRHTTEGHLVGVFASVGSVIDTGAFGTVGVEAVHNFNNLRFYGQFGVSGAFNGSAADDSTRDWYARGVTTFYLTPNFLVSGSLGYNTWSENTGGGTTVNTTIWGARLEYKPDSMPVSGFLEYAGSSSSGSDHNPDTWSVKENAVVAGIRVLFGSNGNMTLRQLGDSVGLSDMNYAYGDPFVD